MNSIIDNNNTNLVKQLLMIENLYSQINIRKALIICDNSSSEIDTLVKFLDEYDHSVSTIVSINKFINNDDNKLLTISVKDFEINKEIFLRDIYINTIFLINYKLNNTICNLFSEKIIVFDLTL